LSEWGNQIANLPSIEKELIFRKAGNKNGWFTEANCTNACNGILPWLKPDTLKRWANRYELTDELPNKNSKKNIGLVMAGNIPIVGFHDLLCVLLIGQVAKIKLSSQDDVLLPYLTEILIEIDSRWEKYFSFEERLNHVDAVIATGSDNSARYFEYYFRTIPKIIRKNRTSVGVIMGEENQDEFKAFGKDVFTYFGLGCRNVSKIFIPENFDFGTLLKSFTGFQDIINHHKYANNYDYQKAIRLISNKKIIDGGFILLENSTELVSPISVLYYEYYSNLRQLDEMLNLNKHKIQCIVSAKGWLRGSIPFGEAQSPKVDDYADNVDTMKFLKSLA